MIDQLPQYKCHKVVRAAKIVGFDKMPDRGTRYRDVAIRLEGQDEPVVVDEHWIDRHTPLAGGYLVIYEDGYKSYSPLDVFEAGYTPLNDQAPPPEPPSPAQRAFVSNHFVDNDGNDAGGTTFGRGFAIGWQHGPLGRGEDRKEPNGAFVDDVIMSAADRIRFYQESRFACEDNQEALDHLQAALSCLQRRTADREARGVEGVNEQ